MKKVSLLYVCTYALLEPNCGFAVQLQFIVGPNECNAFYFSALLKHLSVVIVDLLSLRATIHMLVQVNKVLPPCVFTRLNDIMTNKTFFLMFMCPS